MKILMSLIISLAFPIYGRSHEGHDKTPGAMSAPHGGQLKESNQVHLELVSDSQGFKIYPLDHDMKSLPLKDIALEATIKFPKKTKADPIKLQTAESYFSAQVDAKGAHRYTIEVKATYNKKTEKLSFIVEPQ